MRAFISAFARLEQKVVMRFDPKFLPFVPDNVMVANWVPQQEILGKLLQYFPGLKFTDRYFDWKNLESGGFVVKTYE